MDAQVGAPGRRALYADLLRGAGDRHPQWLPRVLPVGRRADPVRPGPDGPRLGEHRSAPRPPAEILRGSGDHPLYGGNAGQGPELLERDQDRRPAAAREAAAMNAFQWIACSGLALALARDLWRLRGGALWPLPWLVRGTVLLAALVAIAQPLLITRLANAIGIGRGADVVLYLFVLAFLGTVFFFYSQQVRLHRDLTTLASHLALPEPRRGGLSEGDARAPPPPDRTAHPPRTAPPSHP